MHCSIRPRLPRRRRLNRYRQVRRIAWDLDLRAVGRVTCLGIGRDSVVPQEVERVIQGVADQMAGEIQRSLDFYTATAADSHIARLYLSGGTAKPKGFLDKFRQAVDRDGFPLEISEIRIAEDPLTATARGCLIAAMYDA